MENIYKSLAKDEKAFLEKFKPGIVKKLKDDKKMAELSKKLATIKTDIDLDFQLSQATIHDFDEDVIVKLLDKYRFRSLKKRMPKSVRVNGQQERLF